MLKSHFLNTYRHALANNYFLAKVFNDFREIMNRISVFCYEFIFRKKQDSQFISLPIAYSSYENQPTECSSRLTYWVESERTTALNSSFYFETRNRQRLRYSRSESTSHIRENLNHKNSD